MKSMLLALLMLVGATVSVMGQPTEITTLAGLNAMTATGDYIIKADIDASSYDKDISDFSGTLTVAAKDDGTFYTISNFKRPLFTSINGGKVSNVTFRNVTVSGLDNAGAICGEAKGDSRIYNCGILPGTSQISGSTNVGSLVGLLNGTSRVINCYSYAEVSGTATSTILGGIVGKNSVASTMTSLKTIVVNCMFYGEITGKGTKFPVYGGKKIANSGTSAINNYNYYRGEAAFDDAYKNVDEYNCSWPAEERNLTQFEYYRSILNSNRRLCTWWVNGTNAIAPTDDDVKTVGIAKWVLDPSIAPYPVLKQWKKYPSIINPDEEKTWDSETGQWQDRGSAKPYRGKSYGTLTIKVKSGDYPETLSDDLSAKTITRTPVITDIDTLNHDYGYYKVQLPYYNDVFGNPAETDYLKRYWGNYTEKVVTGWKITKVTDDGRTRNAFVPNWEKGYNYADRNCTAKDLYDSNGNRAFAQGGYYYVPEGVTEIEIEAYWGTAFYLHGKDHSLDRMNVTNSKNYGTAFTPAGKLPTTITYGDKSISIYENFNTMMTEVKKNTTCNVYDQAVVLVGNYPLHAQNDIGMSNSGKGGLTIMSADFDIDNEPDFCLPLQWRSNYDRRPIMPVRFDFLPIPELGLAMRHNTYAYAIGIMVPQGHFEITETAFMHTTQFEYMSPNTDVNYNHQQALILNGGQFEQIVAHGNGSFKAINTRNIILGGHVWMKRFTPGSHTGQLCYTRHCAISVMGGEYPEFYLTGLYRTDVTTAKAYDDNPHCYTNGGRFGIMAGAGMEAVKNSVFFEIDHSIIREFYGGGINSANPVGGNITVTINNSLVLDKYCGGPKVGTSQAVTTNAENTIFSQYFGGGNGGTNLYRQQINDKTPDNMPTENQWRSTTGDYKYDNFTPISTQGETATYNSSMGYHAQYEFEVFNQSNGINNSAVARAYYQWAQFGTTSTGNVINNLSNCTIKNDYYGGGNMGNVTGSVTSTLNDCNIFGSVFGAGFSASIPSFPVHDKDKVSFPFRDAAGVAHNGSVGYRTDASGNNIEYTWCYKNPKTKVVSPAGVVIPDGVSTSKPAFVYDDKWYCLTTVSLENLGTVSGDVSLTINGATQVVGDVFGGGNESAVGGSIVVNINNGTFSNEVYGGGALANTNTDGLAKTTTVNLKGGTISGSVYGGGRGSTTTPAEVGGNVTVELNNGVADDAKGCVVGGSIFGCNNINGTPKGSVYVTVYGTQNANATQIANPENETDEEKLTQKVKGRYDVAAVYGGGNLSPYEPTDNKATTNVTIAGCYRTSIRQVYGGGNAASTPATSVTINGTFEVDEVFGGGNGKDDLPDGSPNPGANVGYKQYADDDPKAADKAKRFANFSYGTGKATVNIYGGTIHNVYGGSNTKGNVREIAVAMLEDGESCRFSVDEAYGGGKSASMDGEAKLEMKCIPGMTHAYGGARNADVNGNVNLNITNGTFTQVFGGNNEGGRVNGSITINVEETGCKPVIIGELYGGGNMAPYSVYGYVEKKDENGDTVTDADGNIVWAAKEPAAGEENIFAHPTIDIKSFTSIGNVYGGGYGETAIMSGSPQVKIDLIVGDHANEDAAEINEETITIDGNEVTIPAHAKGKIGTIHNVFGGGNAAKVNGSTTVAIGTRSTIDYETMAAGESAKRTKQSVVGVNISGNVYGGGNKADVTGSTNVIIGKSTETGGGSTGGN